MPYGVCRITSQIRTVMTPKYAGSKNSAALPFLRFKAAKSCENVTGLQYLYESIRSAVTSGVTQTAAAASVPRRIFIKRTFTIYPRLSCRRRNSLSETASDAQFNAASADDKSTAHIAAPTGPRSAFGIAEIAEISASAETAVSPDVLARAPTKPVMIKKATAASDDMMIAVDSFLRSFATDILVTSMGVIISPVAKEIKSPAKAGKESGLKDETAVAPSEPKRVKTNKSGIPTESTAKWSLSVFTTDVKPPTVE